MKTAVIYKSSYGFTEKYAQWIGEELSCPVIKHEKVSVDILKSYDRIIYGGGLYGGSVNGIDLISKNAEALNGVKVIIFTVGLSDTDGKNSVDSIIKSVESQMGKFFIEKYTLFCLRGGIDYKSMSFLHKSMMFALKTVIKTKKTTERTTTMQGILDTFGKKVDFSTKDRIKPLIEYCRKMD